MGRQPKFEKAMSNAQRQREYRARKASLTPLQRALEGAGVRQCASGPFRYTPEEREKIEHIRSLLAEVERLAAIVNQSLVVRAEGAPLSPELEEVLTQLRSGFTRITLPLH